MIDIIIPHFGPDEVLARCIGAIEAHTPQPHNIIVIDDNEAGGRGFAVPVNEGLRQSTADRVVLLNNDVEVGPNWLDGMLRVLDREPSVAAVGPLATANTQWQWIHNVARMLGRHLPTGDDYVTTETTKLPAITFWCVMFSRHALDAVGLLDERFYMYFEDNDWCMRAQKSGWHLGLDLSTVVTHHHESMRREDTDERMAESRRLFEEKWADDIHHTRVLIAIPNQGTIRAELAQALIRMQADNAGCEYINIMFPQYGSSPVDSNRNQIVKSFLEGDWDYLLMIDDDQEPYQNPLELVHHDLDVVGMPTPIYNAERSPDHPIVMNVVDEQEDSESWRLKKLKSDDGLVEVGGIGTGAMLIARRVLEHPDVALGGWFRAEYDADGCVARGEDLTFCRKARAAGFKVWAHLGYPSDHHWEVPLLRVAKQVNQWSLNEDLELTEAAQYRWKKMNERLRELQEQVSNGRQRKRKRVRR